MAVDGRLNFDTKIDTKGFGRGIGSLKDQMNGLIGLAGKLAAALGAAFSAKQVIESAAEVKAAEAQFEQTFGSIRSYAESAINGVAKSSGILQTRLKGVGTSIYAFAKTTGMDSASALDLMNDALQVTADSAAYYDRSLEDTAESLKSFLKGNFENDAALGLSCTETTRNAAANKLYGKSYIELSEAQKQLTLLQMVKDANELSGAMGQAAREADGWENVTGNLKEAVKQLMAAVGQPVLAAIIPIVQNITVGLQSMTTAATAAANALSKVFGIKLDDGTAQVSSNTADLSSNADQAASSYSDMADSAEKAAEANKTSLASFDEMTKLSSDTAAESAASASASNTSPVSAIGGNITYKADADTSAMERKFANFFKGVKKEFSKLFQPLKKAWKRQGEGVLKSLKYSFSQSLGLCKEIGSSFAAVWTNGTGEEMTSHILGNFTNINIAIGNMSAALKRAWSKNNLGTDVIQHAADIFNTILEHNENISKKIAEWSKDIDFEPLLTAFDGLEQALEPFADTVGEGLETLWDEVLLPMADWTIEDAIPAFLDTLSDGISGLTAVWKKAAPIIKDKLWDKFLKPIASWAADSAVSALSSMGDSFKKMCDNMTEKDVEVFLDLAGAVAGIVVAAKAKQTLDNFAASLSTLGKNAAGAFDGLKKTMSTSVTATAEEGGTTFATKFCAAVGAFLVGWEIGSAIRDAIGGDKIDEALFPIFDGIVNFFTVTIPEWWDTLQSDVMFPFYDKVTAAWSAVTNFLTESIPAFFTETIPGWFDTLDSNVLFPIYDKAVAAWQAVVNFFTESIPSFFTETVPGWFSDLHKSITDIFKNIGSWFGDKFGSAWEKIKSVFSLKAVKTFFAGIWSGIKSAFSSVATWFKTTFTTAWQGVKNVFSTGGKIFSGIKDGISDVFTSVVNTLIDGINIVIAAPFNAINDAIEWVQDLEIAGWQPFEGLGTIDVPQIPKLAAGTVVPANYGEFMAVLGDNTREPEVVSPLSTMKQAVLEALVAYGGDGSGQKQPLYVTVQLDRRQMVQAVIDDINERTRRNGRSPLKA